MLKIFEGKYELIGTVILPSIAGGLLLLIPFLDRDPERNPFKRRKMMAAAAVAVLSVAGLTLEGARAPIVNEPAVTSPSVLAGRDIFSRHGCEACHSIHGKGGKIGPDLTQVGTRRPEAEWHYKHFRNPQAVVPGSIMPKLELSDKELRELTDYMLSLK